jgi:hypothetical protein
VAKREISEDIIDVAQIALNCRRERLEGIRRFPGPPDTPQWGKILLVSGGCF